MVCTANYCSICRTDEEVLGRRSAVVVIIETFKGQVTKRMTELMESHNIHTCLIPPNTIDRLQPMDVTVNKPAKAFLKQKFQMHVVYRTDLSAVGRYGKCGGCNY